MLQTRQKEIPTEYLNMTFGFLKQAHTVDLLV